MTDRARGILLAFAGMLTISTDSMFVRLADTDGFDVVFWVGVLTAATMLGAVVFLQRRSPVELLRQDGRHLVLAAGLQACATVCFVLAIKHTSVANVLIIIAASPLATAVISRIGLGERTPVRVWFAILLALAGIAIVVSGSLGGGNATGDLLAVAAVGSYCLAMVLLRGRPGLSRPMIIGLGGVFMAVVAFVPASLGGYSLETWLAMAAMGAVFGPVARVMLATAPRYIPAAEVVLFAPVETVFGTLWAYLAFAEEPSLQAWIGGAVVLAGLLWGVWPRREAIRQPV